MIYFRKEDIWAIRTKREDALFVVYGRFLDASKQLSSSIIFYQCGWSMNRKIVESWLRCRLGFKQDVSAIVYHQPFPR